MGSHVRVSSNTAGYAPRPPAGGPRPRPLLNIYWMRFYYIYIYVYASFTNISICFLYLDPIRLEAKFLLVRGVLPGGLSRWCFRVLFPCGVLGCPFLRAWVGLGPFILRCPKVCRCCPVLRSLFLQYFGTCPCALFSRHFWLPGSPVPVFTHPWTGCLGSKSEAILSCPELPREFRAHQNGTSKWYLKRSLLTCSNRPIPPWAHGAGPPPKIHIPRAPIKLIRFQCAA